MNNVKVVILLLFCIITIDCKKVNQLSSEEMELVKEIYFDPEIISLIKKYSESKIKRMTVLDDDFVNEIEVRGLYINGLYEQLINIYYKINNVLIKKAIIFL